MTLKEIMKIRHSERLYTWLFNAGQLTNNGIYFDMADFWKTTDSSGRRLPANQWEKIEVIEDTP